MTSLTFEVAPWLRSSVKLLLLLWQSGGLFRSANWLMSSCGGARGARWTGSN